MPVSIVDDPFGGKPRPKRTNTERVDRSMRTSKSPAATRPAVDPDLALRAPQFRVLAVLVPDDPSTHWVSWPVYTRARLSKRAGYTEVSGTVTRVLNGIRPGSSSDARYDSNGVKIPGKGHPGLIERGMLKEEVLDIEGRLEVNYRITEKGIRAYRAYVEANGSPPELKDKATCVNLYQGKGESHRSRRGGTE